jgi:hypothetical protein
VILGLIMAKKKTTKGEEMTTAVVEEVKTSGRELDAFEKQLVEDQKSAYNTREEGKKLIDRKRDIDSQMVRGKFMNLRAPGQPVKLTYHKYSTDIEEGWKTFNHGEIYTIQRGFADQINNHYAKISFNKGTGQMNALEATPSRSPIYAFVPLEF